MKKLGILTYHYSINEGAMLQAYALQEVCKNIFPNAQVEMVNYESLSAKKRDFFTCFKKTNSPLVIISNLKRLQKLSLFKEKYFSLSKKRLISDNYEVAIQFINKNNYDGIIVGSDEVWKIIFSKDAARKFPNIYWLSEKIKAKKFSYAASANKTDYKNLDLKTKQFVQQSFESYSLISVRDEFTHDMVLDFTPETHRVFKVIDPTLLIDKFDQKPVKDKLKKRGFNFNKSTVVLNLEDPEISRSTAQFFKELDWQIISITAYCPYADINFIDNLDPLEWASVIACCQFSVTERFHGTIFSILGKVPFLSIEKSSKFSYFKTSKLKSLLEDLQLIENMFVYQPKDFSPEILHEKLEYSLRKTNISHVDELVKLYRKQSLEYLEKVGSIL